MKRLKSYLASGVFVITAMRQGIFHNNLSFNLTLNFITHFMCKSIALIPNPRWAEIELFDDVIKVPFLPFDCIISVQVHQRRLSR